MVEVFCSVGMGVGVGGVENRGGSVVGGGGDASVADGGADGVPGLQQWELVVLTTILSFTFVCSIPELI